LILDKKTFSCSNNVEFFKTVPLL